MLFRSNSIQFCNGRRTRRPDDGSPYVLATYVDADYVA